MKPCNLIDFAGKLDQKNSTEECKTNCLQKYITIVTVRSHSKLGLNGEHQIIVNLSRL